MSGGTEGAGGSGDGPGAVGSSPGLSARDEAVLAVERRSWPGPGPKERAIRERLGISPTRYYQLLNALLDDPGRSPTTPSRSTACAASGTPAEPAADACARRAPMPPGTVPRRWPEVPTASAPPR